MRVPQKTESYQRFTAIKSTLEKAAAKPGNESFFKRDGDRVELTQTVKFPFEGQELIVKKGSAFDNDIKTRDKISVETQSGDVTQQDTFEHFSERKGLIFKKDQEMLTVTYGDVQGFNHSSSSLTFEV